MIIEISHKVNVKKERKKKLAKINKVITDSDYIAYDWKVTARNKDEDIYDLQLFSLSIASDLLEQKFFTNETGLTSNDVIDYMDLKETIKNIKILMFDISQKKNSTHQ
jgi:hypothetical protein